MITKQIEDFAEFASPGTFVAETTVKPCKHGDIVNAMKLAEGIVERYKATPFAFRFFSMEKEIVIDDHNNSAIKSEKKIDVSGWHYINGKAICYDDIPDDDSHHILKTNMLYNNMAWVAETINSYKHVGEFDEEDCIVSDGKITVRGNDKNIMEYRKKFAEIKESN